MMSFSALSQMERCPRQWALANADYSGLNGQRYPGRLQAGALAGLVLHRAMENIAKSFVASGFNSGQNRVVATLKSLGGYTTILNEALEQVIRQFSSNERVQPLIKSERLRIERCLTDLRSKLQFHVNALASASEATQSDEPKSAKPADPRALGYGVYTELQVCAEELGWKGLIDLLILSAATCKITDFKTGIRDLKHQDQLRIYALLWVRDAIRNPSKRLPTSLEVSYTNEVVVVEVPTESEMGSLQEQLAERTQKMRSALSNKPPLAIPAIDTCGFCSVRQLCSDYWQSPFFASLHSGQHAITDVQAVLSEIRAEGVWMVNVTASHKEASFLATLYIDAALRNRLSAPRKGDVLRILDCLIKTESDDVLPLLLTTSHSEIFRVRQLT